MNLKAGYQLEGPSVLLRWGAPLHEVISLLGATPFSMVSPSFMQLECTSLGGLRHYLEIEFRDEELYAVTIGLSPTASYGVRLDSYRDLNRRLELALGHPNDSRPGVHGFSRLFWIVEGIYVSHEVTEDLDWRKP